MTNVFQVRSSAAALAALLAVALFAPVGAQVVDRDTARVDAPAVASWDEASGYGAVERSRAALAPAVEGALTNQTSGDIRWAPAPLAWDTSSGYGAVERVRASRAPAVSASSGLPRVSRSSDLGSLQEAYRSAATAPAAPNEFPYK